MSKTKRFSGWLNFYFTNLLRGRTWQLYCVNYFASCVRKRSNLLLLFVAFISKYMLFVNNLKILHKTITYTTLIYKGQIIIHSTEGIQIRFYSLFFTNRRGRIMNKKWIITYTKSDKSKAKSIMLHAHVIICCL